MTKILYCRVGCAHQTWPISSVKGERSPPYIIYTGINHGCHQSPLSKELLTLS